MIRFGLFSACITSPERGPGQKKPQNFLRDIIEVKKRATNAEEPVVFKIGSGHPAMVHEYPFPW